MQILIRLANAKDAEVIADLSRQTFYETFASQNTPADMEKFMNEQFKKDALIGEVMSNENIFILSTINEEVVGYAKLREGRTRPELNNRPAMEIARIYAVKKVIGKGVGKALMEKCIGISAERQKEVIWLGVWKENETAISFYKRWGFEIFGEQDFLLGNDLQKDWLMKREVVSH